MNSSLAIAVPAAIVGAASFGLASVVQQRATKQVPVTRTLHPKLLIDLVRKPMWVASVVTVLLGLSLQVIALAFGPLLLVQPLLVTSVLFAAVFAAWLTHRRLDRLVVLGSLMCVGGLAMFLLLAQPTESGGELLTGRVLPLAVGLGAVVAACLAVAAVAPGELRALALALATGVFYAITAALMKVVASQIRAEGAMGPFQHPTLYVVCVIGPCGFLLSQNAFQAGNLISPALAVITTVDPLGGALIGLIWFGEKMVTTPSALLGEIAAGLVLIAGIAVLTQRGEHLRREDERASRAGDFRERPSG
jgi:drug/metabolite transporter (DMT)-like permease